MRSCASIAAFIAEPHILLTVVQPTASGTPALMRGLPRRRLALARRQHVAHDHFVDVVGRDARARDRRLDRDGAEVARRQRREVALKAAHRRARRADNHDGIVQHCVAPRSHLVSLKSSRPISIRRISEVPAPIS